MRFSALNKRTLLLGTATMAMLASSVTALAQDNENEDEVIATGIRQSIIDSLAVKKDSTSIVEAISAEDIGKLPDVSIADSLARLPGVTAQRVRGRAQSISIRGLGPDFSIALLNGREQVSASNNRGIEFDQFPSELIAQGIVYKTPDARLATTGVAGAVDLKTVRPLDYSSRQINASAKYVINDNGKLSPDFGADGYRLFGSYIDQTEDGNVGWSIGVTHQANPTQFFSRELKTNQFQVAQNGNGSYYASDNPRTGVVSRDFKRTSVAGALQFEVSDNFRATFDAYYSDFEDQGLFRGVETPLAGWSGNSLTSSTGSGAFVDSATYSPTAAILRTDTEGNTAEILSVGANFELDLTERLSLTADLATSSLDKNDIDYESYAGTGQAVLFGPNSGDPSLRGSMTYTTPTNGEYSIQSDIDYANPANVFLTDPGGWGQVGFIKEPQIKDDLDQIRFEADYDLDKPFLSGLTAGVLYTEREKDFNSNEAFIREGNGWVNGAAPIPNPLGSTDSGSIGLDIVAYDPSELFDNGTYVYDPAGSVLWNVQEEILTYYGMAHIETDGAMPIRGNVGFQYVDVKQSSSAGADTIADSYSDFLPSANLSIEFAEDTFLRFGAAKSVTRPRMDELRTGGAPSINSTYCPDDNMDGLPDRTVPNPMNPNLTCLNISGGNPFLRPFESTGFDLAVEKYFSDAGAVSLAVFSKSVDDYIVGASAIIDDPVLASRYLGSQFISANPGETMITISGPVNLEKAKLQGIEASLRLPLGDVFGDTLEGFGTNLAYTYTDTSLETGSRITRIPGYSKETMSGELYYEKNGIKARVNARHRSGFLSEVPQFDGTLIGADALSETIVDAQIGYEFQSGALEGLSLNLEAYNITDEPFRTENDLDGTGPGNDTFISRHELYGTTYNFTVSKKF